MKGAPRVIKTDEEWKKELALDQFQVLRQKGTERAFTGTYWNCKDKGMYRCAACGNELFSSDAKYDSGTGWPSFCEPVSDSHVETEPDDSLNTRRTEVHFSSCGGHLGHVFEDGPKPTGKRYCINSASLKLDQDVPLKPDVRLFELVETESLGDERPEGSSELLESETRSRRPERPEGTQFRGIKNPAIQGGDLTGFALIEIIMVVAFIAVAIFGGFYFNASRTGNQQTVFEQGLDVKKQAKDIKEQVEMRNAEQERLMETVLRSGAEKANLIRVFTPQAGAKIESPLLVQGEARGYWFFEASFPVRLFDGNVKEISVAVAQADGEWMTEEFVPFRATLQFAPPETKEGTLVLERDNPSGLPEHADAFRIPVLF